MRGCLWCNGEIWSGGPGAWSPSLISYVADGFVSWQIHGIVSDNASNMAKMVTALGKKSMLHFKGKENWVRCFAHILNLISKVRFPIPILSSILLILSVKAVLSSFDVTKRKAKQGRKKKGEAADADPDPDPTAEEPEDEEVSLEEQMER